MPNPKTLAVGVAILTILGMTLALAVPMGPSFTGDDDPENSGVTSAQEDPVDNSTDNSSNDNSTNDNSTDTDNDGDDDDPEDNSGSGENDSNSGSDSSCESDSGSSDCDSSGDDTDDQDGSKDKDEDGGSDSNNGSDGSSGDDSAGDQDGSKDKDEDDGGDGGDGDDGTGDDGAGDNETNMPASCEENGLVQNNTIANEAFGTENESGPISAPLHDNESQFQNASVVVHEGSCIIATVDNNANSGGDGGSGDGSGNESNDGNGNESDDSDGNSGNGTDDGNSGNETDDGTEGSDEPGTCETDGAVQENTLANELFGTENEDGPFSSELHMNEGEFQDGDVLVHEGSCVIATVDNNSSSQDSELSTSL